MQSPSPSPLSIRGHTSHHRRSSTNQMIVYPHPGSEAAWPLWAYGPLMAAMPKGSPRFDTASAFATDGSFSPAVPMPTGQGTLMSPNPSAMSTPFAGSMFNPNAENLSFHNTDAFATDFSLPTAIPMPTDQGMLITPSFTGPMSNFNEGNVDFNNASTFGTDLWFPAAAPMPMDQDLSAISYLPWEPNQTIQPGLPAMGSSFLPFTPPGPRRTACPWAGCMESFVRQSDLRRHHEAVHLGIKYNCMFPGCANNRGTGYCRLEKLRTHQREKHGIVLARSCR